MNTEKIKVLITGGAGFIGSEFVYQLAQLAKYEITVIDSLTYSGSLENLKLVSNSINFKRIDIRNSQDIHECFKKNRFDFVVNFAAESHVDKSIQEPNIFWQTNIIGTCNLLNSSLEFGVFKFFQISTDEVYGSITEGEFSEESKLNPSSPYSASKAAAEFAVQAFSATYQLNYLIARCSNNYGPRQHTEKLIPTIIKSFVNGRKVPLYGDGSNIREWIFVSDTCSALTKILEFGKLNTIYNVSSNTFKTNLEVVKQIAKIMQVQKPFFELVKDRPGHDYRYAISSKKIGNELGWESQTDFEQGIFKTIEWYLSNPERMQTW